MLSRCDLFVRSGNVNSGSLRNAGNNGYYWSSTANSNTSNAYNLNFNTTSVNPSNNNNRYNGFSVRCLALVAFGCRVQSCDAKVTGVFLFVLLLNSKIFITLSILKFSRRHPNKTFFTLIRYCAASINQPLTIPSSKQFFLRRLQGATLSRLLDSPVPGSFVL